LDASKKVALITGGARIGQVVANALAAYGCNLVLTYRGSRNAAEATAAAARAKGVQVAVLQADAPDQNQIAAAVNATIQSLGHLDILLSPA
jgi:3-oxoacyl-[acyl-carrier protein] reductase